jgi:hypothetical protein
MEQYYKNGMYVLEYGVYYVYEIPRYGGHPQLEGEVLSEKDAKELIDTFI